MVAFLVSKHCWFTLMCGWCTVVWFHSFLNCIWIKKCFLNVFCVFFLALTNCRDILKKGEKILKIDMQFPRNANVILNAFSAADCLVCCRQPTPDLLPINWSCKVQRALIILIYTQATTFLPREKHKQCIYHGFVVGEHFSRILACECVFGFAQ